MAPTFTNYLYRVFCKTCQDFKPHVRIDKGDTQEKYFPVFDKEDSVLICSCGTQYTEVYIKDIPEEKVIEQRERFKAQRTRKFRESFNIFEHALSTSLFDDMSIYDQKTKILESDAGLEELEKTQRERRNEIKRQRNAELLSFKLVQRNDSCLCGSGQKYKKCCKVKHDSWN